MNEYLISKLKEGRINKGWKQSDVTTMIGIKNTTLSNYENGITEPDIDTFLQLCELYELDYALILAEAYGLSVSGSDFHIKPSEIEYIKKYRLLDQHGRKMVDFTLQEEYERCKFTTGNHEAVSFPSDADPLTVMAAHDDQAMDSDELEKVKRDMNRLKRPENR